MAKLFSSNGFGATLMAGSLVAIAIVVTINHLANHQATAMASATAKFRAQQNQDQHYKYSVAIDAGSTHSRVILYRWRADKLNGTGLVQEVKSCNVKSGISSAFSRHQHDFQANEAELTVMADGLLNCVRNVTWYVPNRMHRDDDDGDDLLVYLGATAGMRLLNLTHPQAVAKIFHRIKKEFDAAGLKSRRVSILTGQEEGLFAWIAANYLSGTLLAPNGPANTYGIMDMGGSSAQIAYQSPDRDPNHQANSGLVRVKLFGNEYQVNTFSNLCFGTEQAFNRYLALLILHHQNSTSTEIEVPCFPRGFKSSTLEFDLRDNVCTKQLNSEPNDLDQQEYQLIGTGDPDRCQAVVDELVDRKRCRQTFQICMQEGGNGAHSHHPFYAISAYYHLTKVLNLPRMENISRQQYLSERNNICSLSREELVEDQHQRYRIPLRYIPSTCFKLSFIISTLTNLYKFDDGSWPRLRFANRINNSYLGWITGLMIVETGGIPNAGGKASSRPANAIDYGARQPPSASPLIFYLLILVLVALFVLGLMTVLWNHFVDWMKKPIGASTTTTMVRPSLKTPATQALIP